MHNYKITDLLDVPALQQFQDEFSRFSGIAAIIADADGIPVTKGSGFTNFCCNIVRKTELGKSRCEHCDRNGAIVSLKSGKPAVYYCHAGLIDFSAPIIVNGDFIGSIIGGQVRPGEYDQQRLLKTAEELGIDGKIYLEEFTKTKIKSKAEVKRCSEFLVVVAEVISKMAYIGASRIQKTLKMERAARSQLLFVTDTAVKMKQSMERWISSVDALHDKELPPEVKSELKKIILNGAETSSVLSDFVDYIKMTEGATNLSESKYNIRKLLPATVEMLQKELFGKDISISYEIDESVPQRLFGDYGRIEQIIAKLSQGSISRLESGYLKIRISCRDEAYAKTLVISISDSGENFSEEALEDIRHYFTTGFNTLIENGVTKDFGYPMVAMLLKQLSGTIDIKSTQNNETVFTALIPQLEVHKG